MKTALIATLLVFSNTVSAADSPAQVGYCVESLRELFAPPDYGLSAKYRPLFEQWRLRALSLLSQPGDYAVSELLRGQNQAKADWAAVKAESDAQMTECNKTSDPAGCMMEKLKSAAPDPGLRERAAPCMKGPSL